MSKISVSADWSQVPSPNVSIPLGSPGNEHNKTAIQIQTVHAYQ